MAWWESDPAASAWQQRVNYFRQQLAQAGTQVQARATPQYAPTPVPQAGIQAQPQPQPQFQPLPAGGPLRVQPAQRPLYGAWPTARPAQPTAAPIVPPVTIAGTPDWYADWLSREYQRMQAGIPPLPAGAERPQAELTPEAFQVAARAVTPRFLPPWMTQPETLPEWLQGPATWAREAAIGAVGRGMQAFARPEQRAFLQPVAEAPKLFPNAPSLFGKKPQVTGMEPGGVELQTWDPQLGKAWQWLTQQRETPRRIEQYLGVGLQALQEPAIALEEATGATSVALRPESRGMSVEQWFPLTTRTWSLAWQQARAQIGGGVAARAFWAQRQTGQEPDVLGNALLDIASGRATAAEIATANESLGAELVGQCAADPLNVLDFLFAASKVRTAGKLAAAQRRFAQPLQPGSRTMRALEALERNLAAVGNTEVNALQGAVQARGIEDPSAWQQIRNAFTRPFDLTPAAKAERDAGEMWIALSGPLSAAAGQSGDVAKAIVRHWAADPTNLVQYFGQLPVSAAGRKASAVLRNIVDAVERLPSFNAEVFNPVQGMIDVDRLAVDTLRTVHGYTEPGRVEKFFTAYKRLMSEFYLTAYYSPGYVLRNTAGDITGMTVDGLMTFEGRGNIDRYIQDLVGGIPTKRITEEGRGAMEMLTGIPEGESMLPGVLGTWSKKGQKVSRHAEPFGRLPLGEEPRYRRAFYVGLKRWFNENARWMTPDLDPALRAVLGDGPANDLLEGVARAMSPEAKRAVVERVLNARGPAQAIEPSRYVADGRLLDSVSPELYNRLVTDLRKATTPEEAQGVFDNIARLVDEDEARRLADVERLPTRAVATDSEEMEVADDLVSALEDDLNRIQDPAKRQRATQRLEEFKKRIPERERELITARAGATRDLVQEPTGEGLDILLAANRDVSNMRNATRQALDDLRRTVTESYQANPALGDELWPKYFDDAIKHWDDLIGQRSTRYTLADEQLKRLRAGESVQDLLGMDARALAEQRLRQAAQIDIPEKPAGYLPASVANTEENAVFDDFLRHQRTTLDAAQTNAWRAVYGADPQNYGRVLDLLDSSSRDVEMFGKATAGKVAKARAKAFADAEKAFAKQSGQKARWAADLVWEKYYAKRNQLWSDFWKAAEQRWQIAERDILYDNFTKGPRMQPPTGPVVPGGPPPVPAGLGALPGDEAIVKAAILKADANWTAAERAAVGRWTGAGRRLPKQEVIAHIPPPAAAPGAAPAAAPGPVAYTRTDFQRDLRQVWGYGDEEARAYEALADARAQTWAKYTGRTPEDWYTTHLAGMVPGSSIPDPGTQPLMQLGNQPAPTWFYNAEKVVTDKMPNRASVEQIRAILTKGGVKADELEWSGVLDWLNKQKGTVTKEDVLGYLQENRVQVQEVVRGQRPSLATVTYYAGPGPTKYVEYPDTGYRIAFEDDPVGGMSYSVQYDQRPERSFAKLTDAEEYIESSRMPETKWEQYILPGGENYRELELILPRYMGAQSEDLRRIGEINAELDRITALPAVAHERQPWLTTTFDELTAERAAIQRRLGPPLEYQAPHWEEPNVLAHVRFNERRTADGKRILFMEEVQSDWHQAGREAGYKDTATTQRWTALNDEYVTLKTEQNQLEAALRRAEGEEAWAGFTDEDYDRLTWLRSRTPEIVNEARPLQRAVERGVPPAPFAKSWDELALKRMMRWAADEGFDGIGWTTGAQQAERYNLGKVVDDLSWFEDPGGKMTLEGGKGGSVVFREDVAAEQLADYVGKDIARKLIDSQAAEGVGYVTGADLRVGGAGMSGFYDQILPYSANKVAKRWGTKAREIMIETADPKTPKAVFFSEDNLRSLGWDGRRGTYTVVERGAVEQSWIEAVTIDSGPDIRSLAAKHNVPLVYEGQKAWGIDLTDAMKYDLRAEGLPLFQMQRGGAEFLEDGRAILKAFEAKNVSTLSHELGHVFRRELDAHDLGIVRFWVDGEANRLNVLADEGQIGAEMRARLFVDNAGNPTDYIRPVNSNETLSRAGEEIWASGFERYLADGISPSPELRPIFERFKEWLVNLYKKITGSGIDIQLSPEVRRVMNNLLAEPLPDPGDLLREARDVRPVVPGTFDEAMQWYGTDDLDELAGKLADEAGKHERLSSPDQLKWLANQMAHRNLKEPKTVELFGYSREITRERILTAKQQEALYWSLQGINPELDKATKIRLGKQFRQREKELTDWYYRLAEEANHRVAGQIPTEPALPPRLAQENAEKLAQADGLRQRAAESAKAQGIDLSQYQQYWQKGGKPVFGAPPGKAKPQQLGMFAPEEEMPLFTGTAPRAEMPVFAPGEAAGQPALPGMGLEMGEAEKYAARPAGAPPPAPPTLEELRPPAAPEGQETLWQAGVGRADSQAFRDWFGDSKVLDPDGTPKVMYHGSGTPGFESFDLARQDPQALYGPGFYFTDDAEIAGGAFIEDPITGRPTTAKPGYAHKATPDTVDMDMRSSYVGAIGNSPEYRRYVEQMGGYWEAEGLRQEMGAFMRTGDRYLLARLDGPPYNIPVNRILETAGLEGPGGVYQVYLRVQNPFPINDKLQLPQLRAIRDVLLERVGGGTGYDAHPLVRELVDLCNAAEGGWTPLTTGDQLYGEMVGYLGKEGTSMLLMEAGFDGIKHIGGAISGGRAHQVYIAFMPEQIKATWARNFDPRSPELLNQMGVPDTNNWTRYLQATEAPRSTNGPQYGDMVRAGTTATKEALDQMRQGVVRDWGSWQQPAMNAAARRGVNDWFNRQVMPSWFEHRAVGIDYARSLADEALLDYTKRRGFDKWLSYIAPYHYWYTRSGYNWAKRLATHPSMVASYVRTRGAMKQANEQAGRRARFGEKLRVPFPWLPDWMGDALYVDPVKFLIPFASLFQNNWDDSEQAATGLRGIYNAVTNFGFRPYHIWELPYQAGWFSKMGEMVGMSQQQAQQALGPQYPGGFGMVLPQTRVIQAGTALAREAGAQAIPPGGVNIEAPFRRMLGLPAGEVWDPYRLNRMLANMSAEDPTNRETARTALIAQELVARDKDQAGKVWDPASPLAQLAAREMNWSPEELAAAQQMLQEAMQRATLERGMGTVGWALGPQMAIEPAGEAAQLELQRRARGEVWTPGQPEGGLGRYRQFKEQYPAIYPRITQYGVIPGAEETGTMPPGARANWMALSQERNQINEDYNRQVDDLLRARPWDWAGRSELEDARNAALDALEAQYPIPATGKEIPTLLYGMNPAEMWDAVTERDLRKMQKQKPSPESYQEGEEVNWSAYYEAVEEWMKGLPGLAEAAQGGKYKGMTPQEAMRTFEQRYDSPLEAAYKTYQETVADPAWDKYNEAKAAEARKWPGVDALQDQYFDLDKQARRDFLKVHAELKKFWDWRDTHPNPYNRTVAKVGPIPAVNLIGDILKTYKGQDWTSEQLKKELENVTFPALGDWKALRAGEEPAAGTGQAGAGQAAATGDKWWNNPQIYAEMEERVRREGWRAVYGEPWFEKYPRRGRARGGGGRTAARTYQTGGTYQAAAAGRWTPGGYAGRWRPPEALYGGPWKGTEGIAGGPWRA